MSKPVYYPNSPSESTKPTAPAYSGVGTYPVSVKQAAHVLSLSVSTFHRLRARGGIGPQPISLGGPIKYDLAEIDRWIKAKCPTADKWASMCSLVKNGIRSKSMKKNPD